MAYRAPVEAMRFALMNALNAPAFYEKLGQGEALQSLGDFLEGAARVGEQALAPLNRIGDREGCRWIDGNVLTPPGFREGFRALAEGGWIGLSLDAEHGGQGLPKVFGEMFYEILCSTNLSLSGFLELTEAVFASIRAHGNEAQRARWLARLASGEWTGSMNLTEPGAGSDLGLIATRATPMEGGFSLQGSKIFITDAEHDLAPNIVNVVLARIDGAPTGAAGLSAFIVPKFRVGDDGRLGERNAIRCVSLEHKMGQRASPTGTVAYDGAFGELLGVPNRGLEAIFTMVNDARLGVAIQGLGLAETALQAARAYARERRQGRSVVEAWRGRGAADPIVAHPDVRLMLMHIRAFTEPARAFAYWLAMQLDGAQSHADAEARREFEARAALMTPVAKAYLTDEGFRAVDLALQCFGGHGYVEDWGLSQLLRDARVTRLYEGTNGIQAIDLVARKIAGRCADALDRLLTDMRRDADNALRLDAGWRRLVSALDDAQAATNWLRGAPSVADRHAGATAYLRLLGHVSLGWMWARLAAAAQAEGVDPRRRETLGAHARFFLRRVLPETPFLLETVRLGAADLTALPLELE